MERWLLYLHIAAVLLFLLVHGASVQVMWKQRGEADPERSLHLFDPLSNVRPLRLLFGAVIVSGVAAAFVGGWYGQWWPWLSLVLFGAIAWLMYRFGGGFYELIERAATRAIESRGTPEAAAAQASFDAVRGAWQPAGMTVAGLGGLAIILWLMIFKPF